VDNSDRCFAFSYPPTAFMQLANRSIAEEHARSGEEEGLQSTKIWASDLIQSIIETSSMSRSSSPGPRRR